MRCLCLGMYFTKAVPSVEHDSPVVKPTLTLNFVCLCPPSRLSLLRRHARLMCCLCFHHKLFFSLLEPHFLFLPCLLDPLETPASSPLFHSGVSPSLDLEFVFTQLKHIHLLWEISIPKSSSLSTFVPFLFFS